MKSKILKIKRLTKVNTLSLKEQLALKGGTDVRTGRIKITKSTAMH